MDFFKDLHQMFSSPADRTFHGLRNQGATCYLNSVLQVLFMTEDFREAVKRHTNDNPGTECIDHHLNSLFDDLQKYEAFTYQITKRLCIDNVYEQRDATEYFEKILGLTSDHASQIFHGELTQKTKCSKCLTETGSDGLFWNLALPLVNSYNGDYRVVDGIAEYFRASDFSGENQMYCDVCDEKSDATIYCEVKNHPEVLMLLLKRFEFDYRYMTYVKINLTVEVPFTLHIPENQTYELYAVVDHFGDLRSGHYNATIKTQDDERWYRFDDDRVTLLNYRPLQVDNFEKTFSSKMAAIRSGLTPGCLARCLLRKTGKQSRGSHPFPDIWSQRLLQKSHLHTAFECRSPATRTLLGRRQHGKFLWVNAVAVRLNSSQIPPEDGTRAAPLLESSSISLPTDPTPVITQPITEQIAVEPVSMAAPLVDLSPPPHVLNSSSEFLSGDPTAVLSQPFIEQLADATPTAVEVLQAAATETSLAELGLGAYTPVGLIQNMLEFMHVDLGLPWWGAIVVGTVLARMAVFPVIVKGQREAAKLNNVMPEMTKLTSKMNEAKQSGNKFDFAKAYSDLNLFQKKHDVNPLRGFLIPIVQAPVFVSFFIALRKMAYLPVPSMQTGGMLWFADLTAADPFYILPLAVTGTMFFILELGAESGIDNPNLRAMKTVFRIMPFVILPLTINFPTAVFTYWLTSNSFSLAQLALLRHPLVREKLNIPERIKHPASALPQTDGLFESMKKGWKNAQLAQQLEERERRIKNHLDIAAKGPLRQTFTHNPLQQNSPMAAASAKDKQASGKAKPWKDTIG
ncbi:mitochondrial inner membrane protein OXA1L isoform X3 [Anoplopoma fimbria]|uniref:mitochondrial inner membrane protein OXA1L isoform X3 n=1 Tax=Anoplopoma fimbria TaxID=229290 RepID=UPI0023EAACF9|nr:mitochondrial inner membrane protein OXA1L isoform X3 [Anoplopoma fimbria]